MMRRFGLALLLVAIGMLSTAGIALADYIGPHVPTS